jgi:hypothetical protein
MSLIVTLDYALVIIDYFLTAWADMHIIIRHLPTEIINCILNRAFEPFTAIENTAAFIFPLEAAPRLGDSYCLRIADIAEDECSNSHINARGTAATLRPELCSRAIYSREFNLISGPGQRN